MRVDRCSLTYKNDRDTGKLWDYVRKTISLLVLKILQEVSTKIFETAQFSSRNNERDGLVAETVDVCFGRRELRKCWCRASDKSAAHKQNPSAHDYVTIYVDYGSSVSKLFSTGNSTKVVTADHATKNIRVFGKAIDPDSTSVSYFCLPHDQPMLPTLNSSFIFPPQKNYAPLLLLSADYRFFMRWTVTDGSLDAVWIRVTWFFVAPYTVLDIALDHHVFEITFELRA
ncbi:hypothetical protein BD769DRAFT_1386321 [Suillus cothurnatus]|nr:hypothetical protein BD769DRAFT_1386321 [Suillus cothurnatus]